MSLLTPGFFLAEGTRTLPLCPTLLYFILHVYCSSGWVDGKIQTSACLPWSPSEGRGCSFHPAHISTRRDQVRMALAVDTRQGTHHVTLCLVLWLSLFIQGSSLSSEGMFFSGFQSFPVIWCPCLYVNPQALGPTEIRKCG
jgi:hypothetical protein